MSTTTTTAQPFPGWVTRTEPTDDGDTVWWSDDHAHALHHGDEVRVALTTSDGDDEPVAVYIQARFNYEVTVDQLEALGYWLVARADQFRQAIAAEDPNAADASIAVMFAAAIRRTCKERDVRQNELAVAAGYGPDELSRRMTGKEPFDMDDVDRIAVALGMTAMDLTRRALELDEGGAR